MALSANPESTYADDAPLPLTGETALITGSGRGIGRQIAEKLLSLGASIVLHDIDEIAAAKFGEAESLSSLAESLRSPGGPEVATVTGDITDSESVETMVRAARTAVGDLSILINCAGGDVGADGNKPNPSTPTDFKLRDIYAALERNLIGTMLVCRTVAPHMKARGNGAIVNVGSIHAHRGVPIEVGYSCAKAAVVHYTRCLAQELREYGVRVNAVSPGPTKTARFMATRETDDVLCEDGPTLVRYANPEEIADAIAFFAGPASRYISGQVLLVDGGDGSYPA